MPLDLSPALSALLLDGETTPTGFAWLRINWPGEVASPLYSTRPLAVNGEAARPDLMRLEDVVWSVGYDGADSVAEADGALPAFRATATLRNFVEDEQERIRERYHLFGPEELTAEVGIGFRTSSLGEADESDLITLSNCYITEFLFKASVATLKLEDQLSVQAHGAALRPFRPADSVRYPFEYRSEGSLPFLFGSLQNIRLVPWRFEAIGELAADMAPLDTTLLLRDSNRFRPDGIIQIGEEVIQYSENRSALGQLGGAENPLTRPAPQFHRVGAVVYQVPAAGFSWVVADHRCESVTRVRAATGLSAASPLPEADYTVEEAPLDGRVATLVTMQQLPVVASERLDRFRLELRPNAQVEGQSAGQSGTQSGAGIALWQIGPFNSAESPEGALESGDPESGALLGIGHTTLHLRTPAQPELAGRFGPATRAELVVRFAANQPWRSDSTLWVTAQSRAEGDDQQRNFLVPIPQAGGKVAPREIRIDWSNFFGANWRFFADTGDIFIFFNPSLPEAAEVTISGVWWEVEVEAIVSGRAITGLAADVRGWIGSEQSGGSIALEYPAELLAEVFQAEEALGLNFGLFDDTNIDLLIADDADRRRTVSRAVRNPITWRRLLQELLAETGYQSRLEGAKWRLLRTGNSPFIYDESLAALTDDDLGWSHRPRANANPVPLTERWSVLSGETGDGVGRFVALDSLGNTQDAGAERLERAHWLPSGAQGDGSPQQFAAPLAEQWLARLASFDEGEPSLMTAPAMPSIWARAMPGQALRFDHGKLGGGHAIARVMEINAQSLPDKPRLKMALYSLGTELGSWGADNVGAIFQRRGKELYIWIERRLVAILDATGDLKLRGQLVERFNFSQPPTDELATYDSVSKQLLFWGLQGSGEAPLFSFGFDGNLRVAETFRTGAQTLESGEGYISRNESSETLRLGVTNGATFIQATWDDDAKTTISGELFENYF